MRSQAFSLIECAVINFSRCSKIRLLLSNLAVAKIEPDPRSVRFITTENFAFAKASPAAAFVETWLVVTRLCSSLG